jgi:hypothetical protein
MKKKKFAQLALIGLTNGLLIHAPAAADDSLTGKQGSNNNSQGGSQEIHGCGGKHGCGKIVAEKCGGPNGCSGVVAEKCGQNSCKGTVAEKCGGPNRCGGIVADNDKDKAPVDPNSENLGYHLLSEDELLLQLNDAGVKQYQALSPEGKALAREVASQRCNSTNSCKGLNACQTEHNACAGKGSCKGQSKCAHSDKNMVIKLVAEKMTEKRQALTK